MTEEVKVDYVQIPQDDQKCDGCGRRLRKGESATSLFFGYSKTAARICYDCHESVAEQMNG